MWVQLMRLRQIEVAGKMHTYHPGDCIDVGKQSALRWVVDGSARLLAPHALDEDLSSLARAGCGIVVVGSAADAERLRSTLRRKQAGSLLPIQTVDGAASHTLPYARTLLWQADFPLRPELVPLGFRLLDAWEVAAPLVSYDHLACHVGTVEARTRTEAVVRDLRVPLYDGRLLFVKRCRAGRELLDAWAQEQTSGDDDGLCLLRALYAVKPLVCALPVTWNKSVPAIQ